MDLTYGQALYVLAQQATYTSDEQKNAVLSAIASGHDVDVDAAAPLTAAQSERQETERRRAELQRQLDELGPDNT